MLVNGIEREPRAAWKACGAKPASLDEGSWLAEVVEVIGGTGAPRTEREWWTVVVLAGYPAAAWAARACAEPHAARAWYDETDQSGAECTVVLRLTAWTGAAWTVEVAMRWELQARPKIPVRYGGAS